MRVRAGAAPGGLPASHSIKRNLFLGGMLSTDILEIELSNVDLGVPLSDEDKAKILSGNAKKLLRM